MLADSIKAMLERKGFQVETVYDGESGAEYALLGIYDLLILDVLLDNALKYSTSYGTVNVELTRSGRSCLLSVASPGEPLSNEELKNIFKRFYRGDKARSMNGSYGLGLAIAQSVVGAHKGKIWAESKNGYNIFHVRLEGR